MHAESPVWKIEAACSMHAGMSESTCKRASEWVAPVCMDVVSMHCEEVEGMCMGKPLVTKGVELK